MRRLTTKVKRYLVVGIGVYLFELATILVVQALGASAVVAVGLSFWLGLFLSFGLQKFVAFEDRRTDSKVVLRQILSFCLLVIFNFSFTILLTKLIGNHLPAVASRTIALAITTLWNFYLYKTRIFNQKGLPLY